MHFHIITLFPEVCRTYTDSGVLGRAQKTHKGKGAKHKGKKIGVTYYDPRDFTTDKHKKVDDRPYGGGPGMVMQAEPILRAWQHAVGRKRNQSRVKTLITSPRGSVFTQTMAKDWIEKIDHLVLIAGRYEGIDARVKAALQAEEISIGDFILSGGELPALTILDVVARQVPGVLGANESLEDTRETTGITYTRPESITFKKVSYKVPDVLLQGDPKKILAWQRSQDFKK